MEISEKKLDGWAEKLLDTGKRNNLVNFKDTKASTVEVVFPSAESVFEKAKGTAKFEIFDPKMEDEDEELEPEEVSEAEEEEETEKTQSKESFVAQYSKKLKRQNQILVYNARGVAGAAVRNISKKAREYLEGTGVNVAYMAFGFIHWKESETSNIVCRAPVLLVPIRLEQASAVDPFVLTANGDEVIVNPTFAFKMNAEQGIQFPEYNDEGLSQYLEKIRPTFAKLKWEVTNECKIGIFSFLKINMYQDLKNNKAEILGNDNIRMLLGEEVADHDSQDYGEEREFDNPLIKLRNVVDADSSQIEAIEMAKSGRSFVLQGPPGTGKSQTITNMIAELINDGKKVLFVSEKQAALNVVYDKLQKASLGEFCLQLHSHKANKKEVIDDLCRTLKANRTAVKDEAKEEIAQKKKAMEHLDGYATELHKKRPVIEKSLYELYEKYAAQDKAPDVQAPIPNIEKKGQAYANDVASLLRQYADSIAYVGYDFRKNPWYGYTKQSISLEAKNGLKADISEAIGKLRPFADLSSEIKAEYGIDVAGIDAIPFWRDFYETMSKTRLLTPALFADEIKESAGPAFEQLSKLGRGLIPLRDALDKKFNESIYGLDGNYLYDTLKKSYPKASIRFFNKKYKDFVAGICKHLRKGRHISYKKALAFMAKLSLYQSKTKEYAKTEKPYGKILGPAYSGFRSDWDYIDQQMARYAEIVSAGHPFGGFPEYEIEDGADVTFLEFRDRLEEIYRSLKEDGDIGKIAGSFDAEIFDISKTEPSAAIERLDSCLDALGDLDSCLDALGDLDSYCQFRSILNKLKKLDAFPFVLAAVDSNVEAEDFPDAFLKRFYQLWIYSVIESEPALSDFSRVAQDNEVKVFTEKDREQFAINKAIIRANLSNKRPPLSLSTPKGSVSLLLREGEKKRRQKNIRQLLSETGELVKAIKPCFLMSPLSVSAFLSPDFHFDTVIFDEASQIFPWDAVGAIYRGDQLIVVGDSKQMPPSNFFNANTDVEEEDEEIGDIKDFESILDMCSTCMPQRPLSWHYRSRYEELIAFSNKNFYDGTLITFPSAKTKKKGIGIDYYPVQGGIFDRRSKTNRKEAEFVVDLIYENIEKYPDRSLGVVAFSISQQNLIDRLLSKRRQDNPQCEEFFSHEKTEPFFIKNLETVQGDERDTIIFSTAYAKDAEGRFYHNFGPLNRLGGERRLNVAVTRAKENVQLVTSMSYLDIDLGKTSARGPRLLREYLDFAEHGEIALERAIDVSGDDSFDSDFEEEVCEFLRGKGYTLDTQVGCSGYRIDMGLKRPNSSDYVLAIECDGATYHSSKNARDRDRLRQEVLERMGWKFYRVWSTDWFRNRAVEEKRLLEAVEAAIENAGVPAEPQPTPEPAESYAEEVEEPTVDFPVYKTVDIEDRPYWRSYNLEETVMSILKVEAPLSGEWLLKRIAPCFGYERVTKTVRERYAPTFAKLLKKGVIYRRGFYYLPNGPEIKFRKAGNSLREVKCICMEELADGLLELIKHNYAVDRLSLYHQLGTYCGVTRIGKTIEEQMDEALSYLKAQGLVKVEGETVSIA